MRIYHVRCAAKDDEGRKKYVVGACASNSIEAKLFAAKGMQERGYQNVDILSAEVVPGGVGTWEYGDTLLYGEA